MKNIIWKTPSGVSITMLADDGDSQQHAASLHAIGAIDTDWVAVAFDQDLSSNHIANYDALDFVNGQLIVQPASALAKKKSKKTALIDAQILLLESKCARGLRESMLAMLAGQSVPTASAQKVVDYDAQIGALRVKLAAIQGATTQAALDAIAD